MTDNNAQAMSKSDAGKIGFMVTTDRWFCGVNLYHRNWLSVHAQSIYAEGCGRPGRLGGKFPPRIIHPSRMRSSARWVMKIVSLGHDRSNDEIERATRSRMAGDLEKASGFLDDDELLCIQAALFGTVWGRIPF